MRLSDNTRACEALCQCLPDQLKDETFAACLKDDKSTKHWLAQLLKLVSKVIATIDNYFTILFIIRNIEAMSSTGNTGAGGQNAGGSLKGGQGHAKLSQPVN